MNYDELFIYEILNNNDYSKEKQISLIRSLLGKIDYPLNLDYFNSYISKKWSVDEAEVKRFIFSEIINKEGYIINN